MITTQQRQFSGWWVLTALSFVFFANMGFSQFGGAVLNAATVLGLHLDRRVLGFAVLWTAVIYGLSGPVVAVLIGRIGSRLTIVVGSVLMAAGMFLNGTVVTKGWQFASSATFIGLGIGLSTQIPAQTCVTAWFARRRALAVSLVWTAAGLGGFIAPPLLNHLNAVGTWRSGWLFVAGLMLLSGLVAMLFVRNQPSEVGEFVDGIDPSVVLSLEEETRQKVYAVFRAAENRTVSEAARTEAFWMILVGAVAQMTTIYVYLAHGVLHLMGLGHSRTGAAFSVSVFAVGAVIGKLLAGTLGDTFEPRLIWSGGMFLMAFGIFGMTTATANPMVYVCSVALGIGNGISLVCWSTTIANYFGSRHFPAIMGSQVPFVSIIASLGPLAAGAAFEAHHSYAIVFYSVSALSALSAVVLFMAKPPPELISLKTEGSQGIAGTIA